MFTLTNMDKYLTVKKAIDRADPYGLLKMHAPSDEYDLEAEEISENISGNNSAEEIAEIAAKVFSRTFNAAFSADKFIEAAREIRRVFDIQERKRL